MGFFIGYVYLIPCLLPMLKNALGLETGSTWDGVLTVLFALLSMIVPYLIGSVNPAILISRIFYGEDIRNFGSGNAGSTNMLRTYGKKAALATFLCDLSKGAVAVVIGALLFGGFGIAFAGFFAVFGHIFPLYYKFKGGKGVACLAMVVLCESPLTLLILLAGFIFIVATTRFVSLGSIMAAMLYPLILRAFAGDYCMNVAMAVLSAVFVIFMHRSNIKRLWNGKESKVDFSKFSKKKKDQESGDGQ